MEVVWPSATWSGEAKDTSDDKHWRWYRMGDEEGKYQPKAAMRGLFQHRHESCRGIGRTEYDAHDTTGWRRIVSEENRLFHCSPTIKWERQEEEVNSTSQHRRVNLFCYLDYVYVCAMIRCLLVIAQFDYWCIKTYQKHNKNNAINQRWETLARYHAYRTWRHNTCFNHTARLTSWRTLMACFALSPNRPLTRKRHCNREWG